MAVVIAPLDTSSASDATCRPSDDLRIGTICSGSRITALPSNAEPRPECWIGHSATRCCTEGGHQSGTRLLEAPRLDDNNVWDVSPVLAVFAWTSNCAIRVARIRRPARHAGRAGRSAWQLSHRCGAPSHGRLRAWPR